MQATFLLIVLLALSAVGYYLGHHRSLAVSGGRISHLHSLPTYYGFYTVLWCGIPALVLFALWMALQGTLITHLVISGLPADIQALPSTELHLFLNNIQNMVSGNIVSGDITETMNNAAAHYKSLHSISGLLLTVLMLVLAIGGILWARKNIVPERRARNIVEKTVTVMLVLCSTVAIFTTLGIILSVLFESIRFFQQVPITDFIFGVNWSPQTAMREDQVGSSGAFGAIPLFVGTMLISMIAMTVAVPIGLMAAIYLSEYASSTVRAIAKPLLEILAGIPTVVYGFFAALTVAPFIRDLGDSVGLQVASESALAAGLVMGIMIIPFVSSLSDDVINAVPQSLRDGAYGLGATRSETIRQVIIPAALPGIVGGVLLAVSRAIGETMIVVMAAGLASNLTMNPLEAVTTVTVQIVTLLTGDQEFDSAKTLAAFALGLMLFTVTLVLNIIALSFVRKYREQYE